MMHAISWSRARSSAVRAESPSGALAQVQRFEYFGPDGYLDARTPDERMVLYEQLLSRKAAPHAYVVNQAPEVELPAHFHRVPQYQITVDGSGRMGRHDLRAGVIHYADEYTAYGPIVAGSDALWYCVLRPFFDPGGVYLNTPGAKALLRPSRKRYLVAGGEQARHRAAQNLRELTAPASDSVIDLNDDGVAAWRLSLGSHQSLVGPNPSTGGGQYCVILNGVLLHRGETYERNSVLWISADDEPLALQAGPQGMACAVMQFPRVFSSRQSAGRV